MSPEILADADAAIATPTLVADPETPPARPGQAQEPLGREDSGTAARAGSLDGLVLGASAEQGHDAFVTKEELQVALAALAASLRASSGAGPTWSFSGPAASTAVSFSTFATSQTIDHLSGVDLIDVTVSGVSGLTDPDIPDDITASNYLPLDGGTLSGSLTGTDLTLSGNLTVSGAQTLSGAITIPYLEATSTTATSTFAGGISSPGTGPTSEKFGANALAGGVGSVAIGYNARTHESSLASIAIGLDAIVNDGDRSIAIGAGASISDGAGDSIAIGRFAQVTTSRSIALGRDSVADESYILVAGSTNYRIDNLYFGKGRVHASPTTYTINGTGGSGTDIAGGSLQLAGGKGTGAGAGGSILLSTASPTVSGSTLNTLVERMRITGAGNVGIGTTNPGQKLTVAGSVGFPAIANDAGTAYLCITLATGVVSTSTSACNPSSLRFKDDVADLPYGLDTLLAVRPVSFDYKPELLVPGRQIGFIAEELASVVPEAVGFDKDGLPYNVDYAKLTPVLVKAVQELWGKVTALADTVAGFADRLVSTEIVAVVITADDITARNRLCVGSTCITEDELRSLLVENGRSAATVDQAGSPMPTGTTDAEPPAITIRGNNPARIEVGATYSDLGADVTDNVDRDLGVEAFVGSTPIDQANIDTRAPEIYRVTYRATDSAGNTAEATRTVEVYDLTEMDGDDLPTPENSESDALELEAAPSINFQGAAEPTGSEAPDSAAL